jgi:hypothetical protein
MDIFWRNRVARTLCGRCGAHSGGSGCLSGPDARTKNGVIEPRRVKFCS